MFLENLISDYSEKFCHVRVRDEKLLVFVQKIRVRPTLVLTLKNTLNPKCSLLQK
jgi:hypothetical protein